MEDKAEGKRKKVKGGWIRVILHPSSFILCCALALGANAQQYPTKPIRYIVGYTPAGTADMLARAVGQKLTEAWGPQVIIENRPGGGTNIATEIGAKAAPDGYTLFMPTVANAINPTLFPKLNYDMSKDFAYVTNFAKVPGIVVCHPSVPAKNVKDLVALARANPNALRHGSTGIGSPHHLAAEIFKSMTGVKMTHVPYKGATPALIDVVAGHIEIYFGAMVSTIPHVKSGRLRGLGVTSLKRVAAAGDMQTLNEQGLKGFETGSWFGMAAPAGTPRDIIVKLHAEATKAITAPDIRDRMSAEGAEFVGDTPEQFAAFIKSEIAKWALAVRASGA
ncbi:MAG TPA: tripartite tricarboxylate transporter substrate binding protein, partial [Burkholderiales bacterium]|nr:tripartite tricarboxylate transporter substrate binding protein [Burkholderiales bacterium]